MKFHIENMTCGGCARGVTKAIQSVDTTAEVAVNVDERTIEIASTQPTDIFLKVLENAGFPAVPVVVA